MKHTKTLIWSFILLVFIAAIYRIIPGRLNGFAPQWAMAVFAGAVIKNKKWALIMPVLSMFISDLLYQLLYMGGLTAGILPGPMAELYPVCPAGFYRICHKKVQRDQYHCSFTCSANGLFPAF